MVSYHSNTKVITASTISLLFLSPSLLLLFLPFSSLSPFIYSFLLPIHLSISFLYPSTFAFIIHLFLQSRHSYKYSIIPHNKYAESLYERTERKTNKKVSPEQFPWALGICLGRNTQPQASHQAAC